MVDALCGVRSPVGVVNRHSLVELISDDVCAFSGLIFVFKLRNVGGTILVAVKLL